MLVRSVSDATGDLGDGDSPDIPPSVRIPRRPGSFFARVGPRSSVDLEPERSTSDCLRSLGNRPNGIHSAPRDHDQTPLVRFGPGEPDRRSVSRLRSVIVRSHRSHPTRPNRRRPRPWSVRRAGSRGSRAFSGFESDSPRFRR
jgi:hypothetical protein